ncbi:hypothetical protein [Chromohalobacter israelensis]|uniref:hypothetical protein n=1 Tax=Chromohalobacter israelensis TaxID=141390 RepID=UPI0015C45142|nr:hypothetical protein [Chromohalobacter salexigens]
MSKKDFEEFLNKHATKTPEKEIDWEEQKEEWLDYIKQFYNSVEEWLEPYRADGKVSYEFKPLMLHEENIGTYEVDAMHVNFAGQKVTLEPIGTLLIGTKGRIDLEGARGRVQFILADKDSKGMKVNVSVSIGGQPEKKPEERKIPDWTWKIVLREPRKISYAEFNEDNFFDALMEIVNG